MSVDIGVAKYTDNQDFQANRMLDLHLCLLFTPTPEFQACSSYAEFMFWTSDFTFHEILLN